MDTTSMACCGVREAIGMNNYGWSLMTCIDNVLKDAVEYGRLHAGSVIFTAAFNTDESRHYIGMDEEERDEDEIRDRYNLLADKIIELKLGDWYDLPEYINPNHDTVIMTGMWVFEHDACVAYWKEHLDSDKEWKAMNVGFEDQEPVIRFYQA